MPVTVEWLNKDHTILYHRFSTPWDWREFYASAEEHQRLMQDAAGTVDLILDFSEGSIMPSGAITHFRWAVRQSIPNRGLAVIIGVTPFMAALGDVFSRLYPNLARNTRVADELLDALAIINDHYHMEPEEVEVAS